MRNHFVNLFKLPAGDRWSRHFILNLGLVTVFIVKRDGQLIFQTRTRKWTRELVIEWAKHDRNTPLQ